MDHGRGTTIAPLPPLGTWPPGGQDGPVLPLTRVRIVGPSMEPTLANGEWWVVRRTANPRPGDVVLLVHPGRPDLRMVKRIDHATQDGWWVVGDNPASSDDSRAFGPVPPELILGRLWFRYGRDPRPDGSGP